MLSSMREEHRKRLARALKKEKEMNKLLDENLDTHAKLSEAHEQISALEAQLAQSEHKLEEAQVLSLSLQKKKEISA